MAEITITSWQELGQALSQACQSCSNGQCQPVGTVKVTELGAGLHRLEFTADLLPSNPVAVSSRYVPGDEDIPF